MVAGMPGRVRTSRSGTRRIRGHARALLDVATLCATYDTNRMRGVSFSAEQSVNYYDDLTAMIRNEKFDGAIVVNPDAKDVSYAPILTASALINAKKHVFLEWPISYDAAKCASLLKLAARRRVVLGCGPMYMSDTTVDVIRSMILQKRYGRVLAVHVYDQGGNNTHDARHDLGLCDPNDVCQDVSHVRYAHGLYVANRIVGEMPHVVFARGGDAQRDSGGIADGSTKSGDASGTDNTANCSCGDVPCSGTCSSDAALTHLHIMVGYAGGATAIVSSNATTPGDDLRLEVDLERAVIQSDLISGRIVVRNMAGAPRDTVFSGHAVRYDEHIFLSIREFVDCIGAAKKRDAPAATHEYIQGAVSSSKVAKAALLSRRTGIPIYLDLRLQ